jgi:hypothetical protein
MEPTKQPKEKEILFSDFDLDKEPFMLLEDQIDDLSRGEKVVFTIILTNQLLTFTHPTGRSKGMTKKEIHNGVITISKKRASIPKLSSYTVAQYTKRLVQRGHLQHNNIQGGRGKFNAPQRTYWSTYGALDNYEFLEYLNESLGGIYSSDQMAQMKTQVEGAVKEVKERKKK